MGLVLLAPNICPEAAEWKHLPLTTLVQHRSHLSQMWNATQKKKEMTGNECQRDVNISGSITQPTGYILFCVCN